MPGRRQAALRRIRRVGFCLWAVVTLLLLGFLIILWVRSYEHNEYIGHKGYAVSDTQVVITWHCVHTGLGGFSVECRQAVLNAGSRRSALTDPYRGLCWVPQPTHPRRYPVTPTADNPAPGRWQFLHDPFHRGGRPIDSSSTSLTVPFWFLVMLAAGAVTAWVVPSLRRCWRRFAGCCVKCGYDLRATPSRCPECGTDPQQSP